MKKSIWLLPVLLIALLFIFSPSLLYAAAEFEVSDLEVSPNFVSGGTDGSSVTISVTVTNTGDAEGTYPIEIMINDQPETIENVTLAAGDSDTVRVNVSKTAGDYTVQVENLEANFTVAPAALDIINLVIDPMEAAQGEEVTISVMAQNKSTEDSLDFEGLKLIINGEIITSRDIKLEEAETETITFRVSREEIGDYVVQVGPRIGSFTVAASFWDTFPEPVWMAFGAVAGILIMLVVVLGFTSKRKKANTGPKPGKKAAAGIRPGQTAQPAQAIPTPQPQSSPPGAATPRPTPQPQQSPHGTPVTPMPAAQPRPAPQPGPAQPQAAQQPQPAQQPHPVQPQPAQPRPQAQGAPQPVQPRPAPAQAQPSPAKPQSAPAQPVTPKPAAGPLPQQPRPVQPPPPQGQAETPHVIPLQAPQGQRPPVQPQPAPAQSGTPYQAPAATPVPQQPATPYVAPAKTSPLFKVSNLTITPNHVKAGDPVNISAVVTNTGTATGEYSLVLRVGSVVENVTEITLNPGTSQTATFTIVKDIAGDYYVEIDSLRGMFSVAPRLPAAFTVSNLSISPDKVGQGDTVTISTIVTNTGETEGSYSVILRIKGIAENIEEITLGPGRNQRVSFAVVKDAAGFYPVAIEHLNGRFVVEMDWKE